MSGLALAVDAASVGRQRRARGTLRPAPVLAATFLLFLLLAATMPGLVSHADPLRIVPRDAFQAPNWTHPFGTDQSGRDIFARIVHGTRQSMLVGVGATALAMAAAIGLGLAGALCGRAAQRMVAWLLQVMFSFPVLILALLFAAAFGNGIVPLVAATAIGSAPGYARMVFGQVMSVRDSGYVEAARALGHGPLRIVRAHILPNAMRPLVVTATMGVGHAIVWASALSFLGLGAPPPQPEWGTMLSMGRSFVANAWWLTFFPGLLIVLTMLSTTVLGRHLQRRLEGRPA